MQPLSNDQISQFKTHGYTIAPGFFNADETRAFQLEIDRLMKWGKLRNVATQGDGKTESDQKRNLQLCPMYPVSNLIRVLPFNPKVQAAVGLLIGDPFCLHLDQTFLKPAGDGMGTNWHQDNAYFKIDNPLMGTAMWIAVHDATIDNGTIEVIPDKFNEQLEHDRDPMSDHHIRCWPDESGAVPCELKAGGVAFFCYGTPHCTRANTTAADRAGIALHFLHESQTKTGPRAETFQKDRYAPVLTGPGASDGFAEFGLPLTDKWDQAVEALLSHEGAVAGR